jgi:hypothetical protein
MGLALTPCLFMRLALAPCLMMGLALTPYFWRYWRDKQDRVPLLGTHCSQWLVLLCCRGNIQPLKCRFYPKTAILGDFSLTTYISLPSLSMAMRAPSFCRFLAVSANLVPSLLHCHTRPDGVASYYGTCIFIGHNYLYT